MPSYFLFNCLFMNLKMVLGHKQKAKSRNQQNGPQTPVKRNNKPKQNRSSNVEGNKCNRGNSVWGKILWSQIKLRYEQKSVCIPYAGGILAPGQLSRWKKGTKQNKKNRQNIKMNYNFANFKHISQSCAVLWKSRQRGEKPICIFTPTQVQTGPTPRSGHTRTHL